MDDLSLARALAGGDGHAFQLLVERETTAVFRTCYRILGRVDEAEDATQETFMAAYRAISTFRGDGPPGAWLARIATRECWRRVARSRRQGSTSPIEDGAMELVATTDDPVLLALASERGEQVRLAVAALPEPYREVVALRFFSELSLADICAATGRPEGTVKAQLHRAMERLRRDMGRTVAA